ncbi:MULTISPECIES: DUF6080 domain-containing protein [Lysinibacillus]|uniref:DUF6080 domain-containing protein n=1 Tax=Lysinibacillus xylanilyticus TaxID=582475 RepID=A0ABV3VWU8_9BACI
MKVGIKEKLKRKKNPLILLMFFMCFYIIMNLPIILFLTENYEGLKKFSPFGYSPFLLNIFNFDPSIYVSNNMSPIHPFLNFLTIPLVKIAKLLGFNTVMGYNLFFLILQSAINSLSVVIIYSLLLKKYKDVILAIIFSCLFGISSYSIFSAFIPDSYAYAQFIIVISLYYLLVSFKENQYSKNMGLSILNFGITSTNIIPFFISTIINLFHSKKLKEAFKRSVLLSFILLGCISLITFIQKILFNQTWLDSLLSNLNNGGFSYTADFSFFMHWKVIYLLFINPIMTPNIALIDLNIMAFVSDLEKSVPFYINIIAILVFIFVSLGIIRNFKKKEIWILFSYILFAILLHIVVGFGLAVFEYDMYLYAGHFLVAIWLLCAEFFYSIKSTSIKKILKYVLVVILVIILINNVSKHLNFYNNLVASYESIINSESRLDSSNEWEFFSNNDGFKIVRTNLNLSERPYVVFKNGEKLKDYNADYFNTSDLTDFYVNNYLYISISNIDSNWSEDYTPTEQEIQHYFEANEYTVYFKN